MNNINAKLLQVAKALQEHMNYMKDFEKKFEQLQERIKKLENKNG